ncbi:RCC1 and BTB domain-containing protein 2 [Balamuthia mandrillaris]
MAHRVRGHCGSQWYRPVGTTPLHRRYSIQPRRLQRPFHALMTFGRGDLGQLGFGAAMESVSEPTILQEAPLRKRFIHASASWSQNMVITEEQEVYSWGTAGLALGIPHRGANAYYPTYVESCRALKLKTVCCGRHHTVALNTRGEVFAWGDNDLGQVGIVEGQKEGVPQPVRLEKLRKSGAITEIACGLDHSLALTDDQRVWGWGFGVDGQVGNGSPDIVREPVLLDTRAVRVKKVRCGTDFSALLGEDGYIYTFGSSEIGQLGHGKKGVLMHPTAIESIPDAVEDVACGGAHSLALTGSYVSHVFYLTSFLFHLYCIYNYLSSAIL